MCVKEGSVTGDLRGIRAAALRLVDVLSKKDQLTTARNLVERLRDPKNDPEIKAEATDWGGLIKVPVLMIQFLPKAEGGDGLHPDLQSDDQPRGAKNGILEKIRYLTRHELTATAMQSEAQELELFGYRTAVIGSLTYRLVPTKMKAGKTPQEWRDLAVGMRDQSLALARSARERNPAALRSASVRLRAACSKCHNAF